MNKKHKEFHYDTVLDPTNLCGRKAELKGLQVLIERKQRVVLYAPRRYGKSSLVHYAATKYLAEHKRSLVINADFMDVSSLASLADRLRLATARAISERMAVRGFLESVMGYLKNLSLVVDVDPISGTPSVSLKGTSGDFGRSIAPVQLVQECLDAIKRMHKDRPVLLIMDEFQDIHFVKEAEAILRAALQKMPGLPMLMLGSKRALLTEMFARSGSPFFGFGDEMTLGPIPVDTWLPYFNERLSPYGRRIHKQALAALCELVCEVPNSVCEVGFALCHDLQVPAEIDETAMKSCLQRLIQSKEQSLRYQMVHFSLTERSVIAEIARRRYVQQLGAKDFLTAVKPVLSAVQKIVARLVKSGFLEWEAGKGYRLSDPLVGVFLSAYPL